MVSWEDIWILIQGTSKEFDEIKRNDNGPSDSEIQTMIDQLEIGDLILRKIDSCETFYHVGLYIGRRLVIHFTAPADQKFPPASTVLCSSSFKGGLVSMRSVKHFIGQKPYCILRLKTREIPEQLSQKVQEMMDYDGDYHVLKNNCLHFALRLLGLQSRPLASSQPDGVPLIYHIWGLRAEIGGSPATVSCICKLYIVFFFYEILCVSFAFLFLWYCSPLCVFQCSVTLYRAGPASTLNLLRCR